MPRLSNGLPAGNEKGRILQNWGGYKYYFYWRKYQILGLKCGFSIGPKSCGYGLVLHHHGSVIIGTDNKIGNYANILPSCISKSCSTIGDFFFMGYGAIISKQVDFGKNVKVAANSVVNKSVAESNVVVAGSPATIKKMDNKTWIEMYSGDDGMWMERYRKCEDLKKQMGL